MSAVTRFSCARSVLLYSCTSALDTCKQQNRVPSSSKTDSSSPNQGEVSDSSIGVTVQRQLPELYLRLLLLRHPLLVLLLLGHHCLPMPLHVCMPLHLCKILIKVLL
jgi:hypothetical protein